MRLTIVSVIARCLVVFALLSVGIVGEPPIVASSQAISAARLLALEGRTSDVLGRPVARNVIVMISDGCGYNHIDAASLYQYGRTGAQVYEQFPIKLAMSTYPSDGQGYDPQRAWSSFSYVRGGATDSAAASTALSTSVKTYNGVIGLSTGGKPAKHLLEFAEEMGKATGVVTSVYLSHATPAGFVAHNADRNNYEQISQEMILSSAADVIMGTGHPWYDNDGELRSSPASFKYVGGESTWNALLEGTAGADADGDSVPDPWTLAQTRDEFRALVSGPAPKRVLGVAQVRSTLQQRRGGDANADPFVVPLNESVPTLSEMTRGALNVLGADPDGFFLMVEGGAVDWAASSHQSGRLVEEEIAFNEAVSAAVEWVEANGGWSETLLVVTGDHETGYLTGPGSGDMRYGPVWAPLENRGVGHLPGMEWRSGGHTNSLIPLFAMGEAAGLFLLYADRDDPVRGPYLDNTDVPRAIRRFWGVLHPRPTNPLPVLRRLSVGVG